MEQGALHLPDVEWTVTRPFWAGCREGILRMPRCACGAYVWYPQPRCPACRGIEIEWQPVSGNGGPKLRDQLCLLIRQHRLDASRVKQYAAEFCGTRDIRDASREQIQSFITHLAETAGKDRDGLLCRLNSYGQKPEAGAA